MSHSFTKIWLHSIFSTKDRSPLIKKNFENELHQHIKADLIKKFEVEVRAINGMSEHIHIVFRYNPNFSLKDMMQHIKGESSHWVNSSDLTNFKFAWQTGYSAFSVSESMLDAVIKYVNNQKEHHKKVSFKEEYDLFMKKYGTDIVNR
ncbi:MAG: IS200/IS605 family transposase [Ignavibacteria bacterium]|nr:IS200/IS605 family transposase [Ignavibacteria bacterium]